MPKTLTYPRKVTRSFLLDLADDIYDPKTRRFMRLCKGVLQNGPDPTDSKRSMHCGLGELYFAVFGKQPEAEGVSEEDVVRGVYDNSTLRDARADKLEEAREAIGALPVSENLKDELTERVESEFETDPDPDDYDDKSTEAEFMRMLDSIPNANDGDECDRESCSYDDFRSRSSRVAKKLRQAAKLLPE